MMSTSKLPSHPAVEQTLHHLPRNVKKLKSHRQSWVLVAVLKRGLLGRLEGFSRRGEALADLEEWDCIVLSAAEVESPCQ